MATGRAQPLRLRVPADIYLRQGKTDAALQDAERALAIARKLQGDNPHSRLTGLASLLISQVHAKQGQSEQARAAAQQAFTQLSNALGPQSSDTRLAGEIMSH